MSEEGTKTETKGQTGLKQKLNHWKNCVEKLSLSSSVWSSYKGSCMRCLGGLEPFSRLLFYRFDVFFLVLFDFLHTRFIQHILILISETI